MTDLDNGMEMIEEFDCRGDKPKPIRIFHLRFVTFENTPSGMRRRFGAQLWQNANGDGVRQIDQNLYEVAATREILKRIE